MFDEVVADFGGLTPDDPDPLGPGLGVLEGLVLGLPPPETRSNSSSSKSILPSILTIFPESTSTWRVTEANIALCSSS